MIPVLPSSIVCLQPSDRSRTAEELAAEEQLRLERLEAQRLKRMRGASGDALDDDGVSEGEGADLPAGGFAARRAKRRRQDAEGVVMVLP